QIIIQIEEKEAEHFQTKEAFEKTEAEYTAFPSLAALAEQYSKVFREEQTIREIYEPVREKLSKAYSDIDQESKKALTQLKAKMDFTALDLSMDAFDTEINYQRDYFQCLRDLEMCF